VLLQAWRGQVSLSDRGKAGVTMGTRLPSRQHPHIPCPHSLSLSPLSLFPSPEIRPPSPPPPPPLTDHTHNRGRPSRKCSTASSSKSSTPSSGPGNKSNGSAQSNAHTPNSDHAITSTSSSPGSRPNSREHFRASNGTTAPNTQHPPRLPQDRGPLAIPHKRPTALHHGWPRQRPARTSARPLLRKVAGDVHRRYAFHSSCATALCCIVSVL